VNGRSSNLICLSVICCDVCSLQWALSGAIVATTNQRQAWRTDIPTYVACQWSLKLYQPVAMLYQARCYGILVLRQATYQGWYSVAISAIEEAVNKTGRVT